METALASRFAVEAAAAATAAGSGRPPLARDILPTTTREHSEAQVSEAERTFYANLAKMSGIIVLQSRPCACYSAAITSMLAARLPFLAIELGAHSSSRRRYSRINHAMPCHSLP